MGACLSMDEDVRKARLRSNEIDKQLEELAKQDQHVIKILLLGSGESGKSTLVKQMKIIHNDGFTSDELQSFRPTVLDNLLASMKFVLVGMGLLRINLESPKNKIHAQTILSCQRCYDERMAMLPFISYALKSLWNDKGVRLTVARGFEYELNDSALYLFENMSRICSEKYLPRPTDVLRARVRTNGIIETHFKINDIIFRMFDVGGQRSERRKWIYCFDDVKALLYVVALSSYDMQLKEDPDVVTGEPEPIFDDMQQQVFHRNIHDTVPKQTGPISREDPLFGPPLEVLLPGLQRPGPRRRCRSAVHSAQVPEHRAKRVQSDLPAFYDRHRYEQRPGRVPGRNGHDHTRKSRTSNTAIRVPYNQALVIESVL